MRKLPYILIAVGIMLLAFPAAREFYYDWKQQHLLDDIADDLSKQRLSNERLHSEYDRLAFLFDEHSQEPSASPVSAPSDVEAPQMDGNVIAIVSIDKIDLKLPVLEGATKQNMNVGATHLTETALLGAPGNAAIAAHRARTKGRLFNRLGEVEVGDRIAIQTADDKFVYDVSNIKRVEPTDLSVLENEGDESILTLITCDPLVNPTHRLIVQAHLIE
ncbi:class D sortase [Cohnella terricola]|uniref:class D sortase n=1 Tax=Cohnella terricola TaxID=1289167 RepID=UPI001FE9C1B8|nr:class D sortase [Cohnella terricola]